MLEEAGRGREEEKDQGAVTMGEIIGTAVGVVEMVMGKEEEEKSGKEGITTGLAAAASTGAMWMVGVGVGVE